MNFSYFLPSLFCVLISSSSLRIPCAISKIDATDSFKIADGKFLGNIAVKVPVMKVKTPNVNQTENESLEPCFSQFT